FASYMNMNNIISADQIIVEVHHSDTNEPGLSEKTINEEEENASDTQPPKRDILIMVSIVFLKTTKTHPSTTGIRKTQSPNRILLIAANGSVNSVYDTYVGGNSNAATPGRASGQYIATESPEQVCDDTLSTKYLSFGACEEGAKYDNDHGCGLHTGFYFELASGPTLVNGLTICTANDYSERDPTVVSLEGSNLTGGNLTLGKSWTLLYNGSSGIVVDPGREQCGSIIVFSNTKEYKSYRFLVSGKRHRSDCVQYSELYLYIY
ncbi:unnamed protein product, partial [Adineta ricciae]